MEKYIKNIYLVKKMKKKFIILAITISITLIIVVSSLLFTNAAVKNEEKLVLSVKDGYVVLKKGNSIITVYDDIVVDVLPDSDKEALKKGITIESEDQLYSIIEDYDG